MSKMVKQIALGAVAAMMTLSTVGATMAEAKGRFVGKHHRVAFFNAGHHAHHRTFFVVKHNNYCHKYGWYWAGGFKKWGCLY